MVGAIAATLSVRRLRQSNERVGNSSVAPKGLCYKLAFWRPGADLGKVEISASQERWFTWSHMSRNDQPHSLKFASKVAASFPQAARFESCWHSLGKRDSWHCIASRGHATTEEVLCMPKWSWCSPGSAWSRQRYNVWRDDQRPRPIYDRLATMELHCCHDCCHSGSIEPFGSWMQDLIDPSLPHQGTSEIRRSLSPAAMYFGYNWESALQLTLGRRASGYVHSLSTLHPNTHQIFTWSASRQAVQTGFRPKGLWPIPAFCSSLMHAVNSGEA
jgi:hypothetical protein